MDLRTFDLLVNILRREIIPAKQRTDITCST
jgi:hypothetical protein